MNVEQRQAPADPQTKPPDLGCESACRLLSSTTTVALTWRRYWLIWAKAGRRPSWFAGWKSNALTTEPCMLLWSFNIQYEYITRVFAGHRLGSDKLILDLSRWNHCPCDPCSRDPVPTLYCRYHISHFCTYFYALSASYSSLLPSQRRFVFHFFF